MTRQTKMFQKLKISAILISLMTGLAAIFIPVPTFAAPESCETGYAHPKDASGKDLEGCSKVITKAEAKTVCPSGFRDEGDTTKCLPLGSKVNEQSKLSDNPIVKNINKIVGILAGLVGVVVVGTIILGGIQYATAGDKAEAVSAAKQRIINGLIALLAFLFIFAFLQWLVPGGVFK